MERYQAELAHFRQRKNIGLAVSIVCYVLAFVMVGLGAALALGSRNVVHGEYLVQRYAPGADGSITLPADGTYAITSSDRELPACEVIDADGKQIPTTRTTTQGESGEMAVATFDATKGSQRVTCEGGNSGIVVFPAEQLGIVARGWFDLLLTALPFLFGGVALYLIGRLLPRRIAPESLRPMIPS